MSAGSLYEVSDCFAVVFVDVFLMGHGFRFLLVLRIGVTFLFSYYLVLRCNIDFAERLIVKWKIPEVPQ